MSNLSDLLPTGGGQNAVDFVASGTLSNGQAVALKTDGTVEVITEAGPSETIPYSSAYTYRSQTTQFQTAAYAPLDPSKFVIVFGSSGCQLIVGSVSGSTITFSSVISVTGNAVDSVFVAFQPNSNKFIVMFQNTTASQLGVLRLYTLSGTSVTLNDTVAFASSGFSDRITASFSDLNTNLMVLSYGLSSAGSYGRVRTATISGTSLSLGTEVVYNSVSTVTPAVKFLYNSNTFVIAYKNNSTSYGEVRAGEVSGTNITVGSATVFNGSAVLNTDIVTNYGVANSFVVTFQDNSDAFVRVVSGTASGTGIDTIGNICIVTNWSANNASALTQQPTSNKFLISVDGQYTGSYPQYGMYVYELTLSGSTITAGTKKTVIPPVSSGFGFGRMSLAMNTNKQFVVSYRGLNNYGYAILGQLQNLVSNNTSFIGITAEAIADTATGPVNVFGGINEAQSGLTIGSDYYVQADGSIATTVSDVKIGQAISATTINMMDLT
jgi:hypothetical protein